MRLVRPRQWGACWLGCKLWRQLGLDAFWQHKLPSGRQGARCDKILQVLTLYRLIALGSEWPLHRHWFEQSALADLLGEDFGLAEIHRLYQCHDKLLEHKKALFHHLTEHWCTLFATKHEVLLHDLTSTYFESSPPEDPEDIRRFGYSRDKRSDCVSPVTSKCRHVVIQDLWCAFFSLLSASERCTRRGSDPLEQQLNTLVQAAWHFLFRSPFAPYFHQKPG